MLIDLTVEGTQLFAVSGQQLIFLPLQKPDREPSKTYWSFFYYVSTVWQAKVHYFCFYLSVLPLQGRFKMILCLTVKWLSLLPLTMFKYKSEQSSPCKMYWKVIFDQWAYYLMAQMLCQEDSSLSPGGGKKRKHICERSSKGFVSDGSLLSDVFFKEWW